MSKPLFYMATPFSARADDVRAARFRGAARVAGQFLLRGIAVVSPITHSIPIEDELVQMGVEPLHPQWWIEVVDVPLMEVADGLIVTMLPGWATSGGIKWEMEWFNAHDKPIFHFNPQRLFKTEEWAAMMEASDAPVPVA